MLFVDKNILHEKAHNPLISGSINELMDAAYKSTELVGFLNTKNLSNNQRAEIKDRHYHLTMGTLLSASELLSHRKIEHVITRSEFFPPHIVISTDGNHYINRLAARLNARYNLRLTVDPFSMSLLDAGGVYWNSRNQNKEANILAVGVQTLRSDSLFQNPSILHEFNHAINYEKSNRFDFKPYHVTIKTNKSFRESEGGYNRFSVDEFLAHRTSIRVYAHTALTNKLGSHHFNYWYHLVRTRIQLEMYLTDTTLTAIKEQINHRHSNQVSGFKVLDYQGKEKTEGLLATYKLASYNKELYTLMEKEFQKYENKSESEKKEFLKKVIRVLTIPEIKKMDGQLPSIQSIESLLKIN